jgi:hypothetical protein
VTHIGRSDLERYQHVFTGIEQTQWVFAILPYLGGDQGRETSAGDVAHLV